MTGWLNDKNFSGLVYCLFGLLILSFARNKIEVIGTIAVFSGLLWATGSRTSIAAYAAGLIWIVVAHRMKTFGRITLGVALYWLIDILTSDYAQSGVFADRTGTDALRSLIDQASEIKVQASGFFGQGLGEAYVYLAHTGSKTWFLHNSYWSALIEGGWPWMILVVTITLLFIVNVFSGKKTLPPKFYVVQGAGVAIMIVHPVWARCSTPGRGLLHAVLLCACCCLSVNSVWVPATMRQVSKALTSGLRFVMLKKPITTY